MEYPFQTAFKIFLYNPRVGCRLNRPVRFIAEPLPVSYLQGNIGPIVAVFSETLCNINILRRSSARCWERGVLS